MISDVRHPCMTYPLHSTTLKSLLCSALFPDSVPRQLVGIHQTRQLCGEKPLQHLQLVCQFNDLNFLKMKMKIMHLELRRIVLFFSLETLSPLHCFLQRVLWDYCLSFFRASFSGNFKDLSGRDQSESSLQLGTATPPGILLQAQVFLREAQEFCESLENCARYCQQSHKK